LGSKARIRRNADVNKAKKTKDLSQAETSDDGNKGAPAPVDIHPETKAGNWTSMGYNPTWQARIECRKPAPISRTWPRANRSAYNTELSRANYIGALLSAAPHGLAASPWPMGLAGGWIKHGMKMDR